MVRRELLFLRWRIRVRYAVPRISHNWRKVRHWLSSAALDWGAAFGTGIAMGQWDEFGPALFCFAVAALVLLLRALVWEGKEGKQTKTIVVRLLRYAWAVVFFVMCFIVTWAKKGDKPWSPVWNQYATIADFERSEVGHIYPPSWWGKPDKSSSPDARRVQHEVTDVALEFAGRPQLTIQLANTTAVVAQRPKIWFQMTDTTNCFTWPSKPDECVPVPLQTQLFEDYINSYGRLGPWQALIFSPSQIALERVRSGETIIGVIGCTCFNCKQMRRYYILFKLGEGGWFYPIPNGTQLHAIASSVRTVTDDQLQHFVDKEIPLDKRRQIPEWFDYSKSTRLLP